MATTRTLAAATYTQVAASAAATSTFQVSRQDARNSHSLVEILAAAEQPAESAIGLELEVGERIAASELSAAAVPVFARSVFGSAYVTAFEKYTA